MSAYPDFTRFGEIMDLAKGRTIAEIDFDACGLLLVFTDGSRLTVETWTQQREYSQDEEIAYSGEFLSAEEYAAKQARRQRNPKPKKKLG